MRLIDRDALNEMLSAMLKKIGSENITWDDAMATIDHADDVDAIPIEWLKRWFETQVWRGSSPTDRIHCKASDIIEDWEKENARNNSKV